MRHPDEGTIHAWIDGALSEAEAADVAVHVAACDACAAAAAEARGVIAAASRILLALDDVPGGVLPQGAPAGRTVPRAAGGESTAGGAPAVRGRPSRWTAWPVLVAASIVVAAAGTLVTIEASRRAPERSDRSKLAADTAPAGSSRQAALAGVSAAPEAAASREAAPVAPDVDVRPEALPAPPASRRAAVVARARSVQPPAPTAASGRRVTLGDASAAAATAPTAATADAANTGRDSASAAQVAAEEPRNRVEGVAQLSAGTPPDTTGAMGAATGRLGGAPRSLRGRVVDASGQPVAGASVSIAGTAIAARTASDGRYVIRSVPPDARVVTVRQLGFVPASVPIAGTGPETEATISLTPAPLHLGELVTTGAAAEGRRSARIRNAVAGSPAPAASAAPPSAAPSSGEAAEATAAALERSAPRVIEGLRLLEHTLQREDRGRRRDGVEIVDRTQDVHILTYEARPGVRVRLVVRLPAATTGAVRGAGAPEDTTPLRTEGEVSVIRWREEDGVDLQLSGPLSVAELEALRARVVTPPR